MRLAPNHDDYVTCLIASQPALAMTITERQKCTVNILVVNEFTDSQNAIEVHRYILDRFRGHSNLPSTNLYAQFCRVTGPVSEGEASMGVHHDSLIIESLPDVCKNKTFAISLMKAAKFPYFLLQCR
jgi:hypothetical protein